MTAEGPSGPKLHTVTVVKKHTVVRYRQLLARLANLHKRAPPDECQAQGVALLALADFLVANGEHGTVPAWLQMAASSLTDVNLGKSLPSNVWRNFALISLGMKALTMGGVKREEAARQAHRAVNTGVTVEILLQRYDEFRKGRVKNPEARHLFNTWDDKLAQLIEVDGFEAAAKRYFELADAAHRIYRRRKS
jgi:hypothetical protein